VAALRRHEQRRGAVGVGRVQRRAELAEARDHVRVAGFGGHESRGAAVERLRRQVGLKRLRQQ
jgi:hypothetical protein